MPDDPVASAAPRSLRHLDPRHALARAAIAVSSGATLAAVLWLLGVAPLMAAFSGWDLAGLVLLVLAWANVVGCTPAETHRRAAAEDPGRTAVYFVVIVASTGALFTATLLSRMAKTVAPDAARELVGLCIASVALSWALATTAFTLRYAHLYYREDAEGVGGLQFPGDSAPSYFDFAYFAFTIGMCFQVSDVTITSPQIRRAVLLQAMISFVYNTVILAFTLNLVFGLVG